jgi:uncharacterized membrane protein
MADLVRWVAGLPLSHLIRKISWLIPLMQTIHILAIGMILSSVIMIDLRIWGYSRSETANERRSETANERTRRFLPWIWVALALLTVTGIGLILGNPRSLSDPAFGPKMLMMGIAIVTTVVVAVMLQSGRRTGDGGAGARKTASVMAAVTLVLWVGVTFAGRGRWISNVLVR